MTRLYNQYSARIQIVTSVVGMALVLIVGKLFAVQVLQHEHFSGRATRQGTLEEIINASRGNILDRNGEPLTSNIVLYSFAADPTIMRDKVKVTTLFSKTFGRPANYYRNKLNTGKSFVWLERNVTRTICNEILAAKPPGIIIRQSVRRNFPYGHLAAPVVGFTDVDNKGISGLESEFQSILSGVNGRRLLRKNAKGEATPDPTLDYKSPIHGADIHTTINIDYQSIFMEEMEQAYKRLEAKSINGIIMNPNTGEILAVAQYPSFDPLAPQKSAQEHLRLKAVTDAYEPGSTLKVITATAAIEENIYTPADEFDVEDGKFSYHNLTITDTRPHDVLSLSGIIAQSSNIGIIKIAEALGSELLYRYYTRYGLGTRTGGSLPGESPGSLREIKDWSALSIGELAMGHEVAVTTLQIASIYSAIANGGFLMRPMLVRKVTSANGDQLQSSKPEVIRRVASSATMAEIRKMLLQAVEEGTGSRARIPGFRVGGKTGTAQKFMDGSYSDKYFIASFVAMIPADRPKLVCVVVVDEPRYADRYGSMAAAPIVGNTFKRIIHFDDDIAVPARKYNPILAAVEQPKLSLPIMATRATIPAKYTFGKVPNFKGLTLRKAISLAKICGVQLQISGSGQVVLQSLKPGTRVNVDSTCLITLATSQVNRR